MEVQSYKTEEMLLNFTKGSKTGFFVFRCLKYLAVLQPCLDKIKVLN